MRSREKVKPAILLEAKNLYFERGFRKVTVDEIALNLRISKKTIYKYFPSKKELLEEIVKDFIDRVTKTVYEILNAREVSFPDKLVQYMSIIGMEMGKINSVFFSDLRESTPDLWHVVEKYKQEAAFLRFNVLIEEGMAEGYIKKDINKNIVVALYASAIENLLDPVFISRLPAGLQLGIPDNPYEIFEKTLMIIYQGILTEDAVQRISAKS